MTKNKFSILDKLIAFNGSIPKLKEELIKLSWDGPIVVTLTKQHLESIVDRFIHNKISEHDLIEWANMIECREDIAFENLYKDQIQEFIFNIANPDLDGFEYIKNLHKTKLF